ncbi:MAG: serine hydrolase [Bacteroidia bacterium]
MKTKQFSGENFLSLKIPMYVLLLSVAGVISVSYLIVNFSHKAISKPIVTLEKSTNPPPVHVIRQNDYELIKPLLLGDLGDEDVSLFPLKEEIKKYVDQQKSAGIITSASVYLRKLNNGYWISVNEGEEYSPGSLMKVPTMITYLKDAERNPELLNKEILFKKHFGGIPEQTLTGKTLVEGKTYTVKELIYYMIVYSDNDAAALLNQNVNFATMQKLFADIQLPVPNSGQPDYLVNSSDYSRFFRILYNGSYLNWDMSQYALNLLTQSAFKSGLVKDIDLNVKVAHKFGERNNNGEQQLHEFGIVYLDNSPYLIGVMTKGADHTLLPNVISGVSDIIYTGMKKNNQ